MVKVMSEKLQKTMKKLQKVAHERTLQDARDNDESALVHKERIVAQSKQLVNAAQRLSLNEKRVLYMMITQINSMKTNNPSTFRVRALDFIQTFDIAPKNAYKALNTAIRKLITKQWEVVYGEYEGTVSNWISDFDYHHGEGWVQATITPKTMWFLEGLGKNKEFSQYRLKEVVDFKSKYTWRLFELITRDRKDKGRSEGWYRAKIDDLRNSLEVPKSYNFTMFKKQVLEPAIKEIEESRNLTIQITMTKLSRKVDKILFEYVENEQQKLDL